MTTLLKATEIDRNSKCFDMVNLFRAPHYEIPKFPREFAPGTFWFTSCLNITVSGVHLHNHNSCFLLIGTKATALIDTAVPFTWHELREQLCRVLGDRPLDYIFATHAEAPHMGNTGPLMEDYPTARLVGDLRNYELYYPELEQRFLNMVAGDQLDLGGRTLLMVPAAIHDLPNSLWGYEPEHRILFVSDGFPYTHDHFAHQCAMTSEELPHLPRPEDAGVVIESALNWTRYVDAELTIRDLDALLERYPVEIIAPAHGGVITNPRAITDIFKTGLRGAYRGNA